MFQSLVRVSAIVLATALVGFCLPRSVIGAEPAATQPAAAADATGITGTWKYEFEGPGGSVEVVLKLKQDGEKLTGTITGFGGQENDIEDGTFRDGQFQFKTTREFNGQTMKTMYTGTCDGKTLKGKSETTFARSFEAKRGSD
jgi:hypothetical protein